MGKLMEQIQLFNFYYFLYIAIAVLFTIISVKFLDHKTDKFRRRFIFSLIMINLIIHFLKVVIYPYTLVDHVWTKVTFEKYMCFKCIIISIFIFC